MIVDSSGILQVVLHYCGYRATAIMVALQPDRVPAELQYAYTTAVSWTSLVDGSYLLYYHVSKTTTYVRSLRPLPFPNHHHNFCTHTTQS